MLIYAVADIHGRQDRIKLIGTNIEKQNPDVLVIAGDITNYTDSLYVIKALSELPVPVLAVRGNTDLGRVEKLLKNHPNISSIHLKELTVKGVPFVGIGGAIPVPFRTRLRVREKRLIEKIKPLVKRDSVLVAHPPPRGILDMAFGKIHAGCLSLFEIVSRYQPRLLICGHIHESPGTAHIGNTLVVNCNIGRNGSGALIHIDGDQVPKVTMLS